MLPIIKLLDILVWGIIIGVLGGISLTLDAMAYDNDNREKKWVIARKELVRRINQGIWGIHKKQ